MRRILTAMLIAITMMAIGNKAKAQVDMSIPGTTYSLRINTDDWRYLRSFQLDDGADIYLYYYVGQTIIDGEGDTILPFMRIYVNENYDGDVYELAYERYELQPFQSLNEYTKGLGLPSKGGIAYDGVYTNPRDQKDYRFLMTYFRDKDAIIELRLETTKDSFDDMEFEFKDILGTLK